jgi:threonyl-tRNA synthetase
MAENKNIDEIRHTLAHVLAAVVLEKYPATQLAIGPTIDNGFYYDMKLDQPLSVDSLPALTKKMKEMVKQGLKMTHEVKSINEALQYYEDKNQPFKVELINDLAKEGNETVTFYTIGNFTDLCRGGHVETTSEIDPESFQLDHLAGAYWRGNENNPMLTRIYGLSFQTPVELNEFIRIRSEAAKRDHRKLGVELDLFTFSDLVGGGLPLWTPKGTLLRNILDDYVWQLRKEKGYQKVAIPHITKKDLYETSGHWQKFKEELFRIKSREGHEFAMKPMNCPHHTQIFNHIPRSYRNMPQRYSETTMVYRDEQSGELSGLSRVRSFTQDDAHVFCRPNQVKDEMLAIWDIISTFYNRVGFNNWEIRLSLHDPNKMDEYLGSPENWQNAEDSIRQLAIDKKVDFVEQIGEAAFYGPKIDFIAKDSLDRQWQIATIQLDLNMPERFDLFCINESGEKERIVMIHAAIMGSIERFLSIIIEHFAGAFPVWMAPVQVGVIPVSQQYNDFSTELVKELEGRGIRVELDDSNESVGRKIRNAQLQKLPYMVVIGEKEKESGKLAVRGRGESESQDLTIDELASLIEI